MDSKVTHNSWKVLDVMTWLITESVTDENKTLIISWSVRFQERYSGLGRGVGLVEEVGMVTYEIFVCHQCKRRGLNLENRQRFELAMIGNLYGLSFIVTTWEKEKEIEVVGIGSLGGFAAIVRDGSRDW